MGDHCAGDDPKGGRPDGEANEGRDDRGLIDLEPVHAVLDHPRRRVLLDVVADVGEIPASELAVRIAARERDVPPSAVTEDQRRAVAVGLHHVHLPKLVDNDVVVADDERIELGPNAEHVIAVLGGIDADGTYERSPSDAPG